MIVGFTTTYSIRISIRARCTTLCDKVCQWLATGRWFSPCPKVSSTNATDRHDIPEILLKVTLNTITLTRYPLNCCEPSIHSFWRIDGKCKSNNKYNSHVITFENCCHILFMVSLYYKFLINSKNDMNKNIGNLSGRGFSVMGFPTSDKHPSGLFVWGIYVAKYFEKYIITTYRWL